MKEKIKDILKQNHVDFKIGLGDFYDFIIYSLNNKIVINIKTYHDSKLNPYYFLQIKVIFKNQKNEYNSFSCDFEHVKNFFVDILQFLGVIYCD